MPRPADVDRVTGEVRRRGPATPVRNERERPGRRRTAHIHEALQPVAERQGGADEPHRRAEVTVRPGLDGEAERASALPAFIERYNREHPHSACRGLPPMSRIIGVNNLSARNI